MVKGRKPTRVKVAIAGFISGIIAFLTIVLSILEAIP